MTRPRRRLTMTALAVLTVGALTAGCDAMQSSPFTQEQAEQRVAARAQEAFQHLRSGATLTVRTSEPKQPCDTGSDRTFVDSNYNISYPPGWPVDSVIAVLADYWSSKGYKKIRDERADPKLPAYSAEDPDGFRIGAELVYRDNGRVDAYLISSSPCI